MNEWSAWNLLLRAVVANEPFLPALRPHLLRLRSWIIEAQETAPRHLRRRRALLRRAARSSRHARRTRRSSAA